jgi:hypothetical protein
MHTAYVMVASVVPSMFINVSLVIVPGLIGRWPSMDMSEFMYHSQYTKIPRHENVNDPILKGISTPSVEVRDALEFIQG